MRSRVEGEILKSVKRKLAGFKSLIKEEFLLVGKDFHGELGSEYPKNGELQNVRFHLKL